MKQLKVRLTLLEEALGSLPADPEIHDKFIASKAPDAPTHAEELQDMIATEGLDVAIDRAMTVFPRDPETNEVYSYDYQIKGMFKDSCGMLRREKKTKSAAMKAYKKIIDGNIFVSPRRIYWQLPEGAEIGVCQRPLRAQTMQGERVALASSETVPAGSSIEFIIYSMNDSDVPAIKEWLAYGKLRGFSQWRNSGKGRFECEILEETDANLEDFLTL
jgi:hypothetical protein